MLAKLQPSSAQVRWYVQSALNGFETLDHDSAVENARQDLQSLLAYLDALALADEAVLVLGISGIEQGVRLEVHVGDAKVLDPPNLKVVRLPTI